MATEENGRLCYGSLSSLKQEAQVGKAEIKEVPASVSRRRK